MKPIRACQIHKYNCEGDADQIVSDPAYDAFGAFRRGRPEVGMPEDPIRHIAEPAPDQAKVRGTDLEDMLQKQGPEVKSECRADSNEDRAKEE